MPKQWIAVLLLTAACEPRQPNTPASTVQFSYDGAGSTTQTARIAHGRRLAEVLDCTGCHGPNLQGTNLADSADDGAMYARNVTLLLAKGPGIAAGAYAFQPC